MLLSGKDNCISYTECLYNIQWILYKDTGNTYFTTREKDQWILLLPQLWLGIDDQNKMQFQDVLKRLTQLVGKEQVERFIKLILSLQ